jgi:hypothetical protein
MNNRRKRRTISNGGRGEGGKNMTYVEKKEGIKNKRKEEEMNYKEKEEGRNEEPVNRYNFTFQLHLFLLWEA